MEEQATRRGEELCAPGGDRTVWAEDTLTKPLETHRNPTPLSLLLYIYRYTHTYTYKLYTVYKLWYDALTVCVSQLTAIVDLHTASDINRVFHADSTW